MPDTAARNAVARLRTPEAVRERCHALLEVAAADGLPHFALDLARLDDVADYVAAVIRSNYPDLVIPYHARWRHFEVGGVDRWGDLANRLRDCDSEELARTRIDLCTVSVLLDAGAGPGWSFREPQTGQVLSRSEGLAVASLHAFSAGLFSGDSVTQLCADAEGLSCVSEAALADSFQVSPDNPLAGVGGRVALLRNLGAALRRRPDFFVSGPRVGALFDYWRAQAVGGELPARYVLSALLEALAPIWPGRLTLGGENLGDVWGYPMPGGALTRMASPSDLSRRAGEVEVLVPFHKLSQWLAYSLVEVLEQAGLRVSGLDELTGLAEYRNGGLFIDLGVLALRDSGLAATPLAVDHPAVVEWRALTVALLDRLAPLVRSRLGGSAEALPLACLLQGGTWDAGRRIARERRADGGPPLRVVSDGTVF